MALDGVIAAAREAGRIAMHYFNHGHDAWEKGPGQIVTTADLEIDAMLAKELPRIIPAGWLSEESEDDLARLDCADVWIVDPIDGTRSFAKGKPEFTISIALAKHGLPGLGVVLNPAKDELFTAVRGQGAMLNGEPIAVSSSVDLSGASILVSQSENRKRRFFEMLPQAHVREIGSLAYKLAKVACGEFDGFMSWRKARDWDIAAALLLISEAGGCHSDARGKPVMLNRENPWHDGLLAGPEPLHSVLPRRSGS